MVSADLRFLIFFSNGGFFADGTNVIAPAVAERLGVDRTIILNMNTVAGIVGVIIAIIAGQLNQRIGPAKVAAGCLILAGLGHIATGNAAPSWASAPWLPCGSPASRARP